MANTTEILEELLEKRKKSKLSKVDSQQVIDLLKTLKRNEPDIDQLIIYLASFPSEVSVQCILEILDEMHETEQMDFIWKINNSPSFDKNQGYMTQLDLAKKMVANSPSFSIYLLLKIAGKATEGGNKLTSQTMSKKLAEEFIKGSLILSFNESIGEDQNVCSLSIMVIGGLIEGKFENELVMKTLEWIEKLNVQLLVAKHVKKQIQFETRYWNLELKGQLKKLGFIEKIIDAERIPSDVKVSYLAQEHTNNHEEIKVAETKLYSQNEESITPSARPSIYFEKIKGLLNELEVNTNRKDDEILKLQADASRAASGRMYAERKLAEAEKFLSAAVEGKQVLVDRNKQLTENISSLEELLNQKEDEFSKTKEQLLDMNEHEVEYSNEEFKNKLKKKLRIEYMDFCEIEQDEITLPLGENLREQIRNIFSILNREGISFDGGMKK